MCSVCVPWFVARLVDARDAGTSSTLASTHPDFGREGTDQRGLAVVGLHARLLLVELDGLVAKQPDKLDHALQQLAAGTARRTEDHDFAFHGEGKARCEDGNGKGLSNAAQSNTSDRG